MAIDFKGKVAIVTGAGNGLGKSHALALAKLGAKVVVNDLGGSVDGSGGSSDAANAVVEQIRAEGGEAVANGASVSDRAGAESIVKSALDSFGTLDVVINNAGILRDKSFAKVTLDDFELVVNVHLLGSAYVTRAAWPVMVEKGYGRVVLTTSSSGLYGNFGQANYGAAKLGLVGLMNTLKLEGERKNVRVNCIAPIAATRMTENLGIPEEIFNRLRPELVTPAVLFLCSEGAPNGVTIEAGAGHYAKVEIIESAGVSLKQDDVSADDVANHWDAISDMTGAKAYKMGGEVTAKLVG